MQLYVSVCAIPITLKEVTYKALPGEDCACAHLGIVTVTSLCGWLCKQGHLLEAALWVAWLLP